MGFTALPLFAQAMMALAALILFTSFLLLAQTRVGAVITTFAWQGALLAGVTALVAYGAGEPHLYLSALLTLALKGIAIPWLLHRLAYRLHVTEVNEELGRTAWTLIAAAALVIFAYFVALPIEQLADPLTRPTIAVSVALVLLGMLMLVTRHLALSQVVGFMAVENGLFFAAVAATRGMPMVVELGIAFDVLVAAVIFGVFFFQIRESIDSLDIDRLNRLSEAEE